MDNFDAYLKIISDICKKRDRLIKNRNKLIEEYELLKIAEEFEEQNKNNIFNAELLKTFYSNLNLPYTIDDIKKTIDFLNEVENLEQSLIIQFSSQIEKGKKKIAEFKDSFNKYKYYNYQKITKLQHNIKYLDDEIEIYNYLLDSIESKTFTKIIDGEAFERFMEVLKISSLNDLERSTMMYDLTKSNAAKMKLKSNQIKQAKKKQVRKANAQARRETIESVETTEVVQVSEENVISPTEVQEVENIVPHSEENMEMQPEETQVVIEESNEIKNFIDNTREFLNNINIGSLNAEESEIVELTLIELNNNFDKKRNIKYNNTNSYKTRKAIIVKDILEILIPKLENCDKEEQETIIDLIKDSIEKYKNLEQEIIEEKKELAEKQDVASYINAIVPEETTEFVNKVIDIINELNETLYVRYTNQLDKETYNEAYEIYTVLSNAYADYNGSLNDFIDADLKEDELETINEMVCEAIKIMQENYKKAEAIINSLQSSPKEELLQKGLECYKNPINNIIVFVDEDGKKSIVEDDIIEDETLGKSDYKKIIDSLSKVINDDFREAVDGPNDHKVKYSAAEDILKKYRLKSNKSGQARIFYGRYNTTLFKIYPELSENTHIYMVYKVSYGNVDGRQKERIHNEATIRCTKNSNSVDYVRELMTTDWDSLTKEEYAKKKAEVDKYLHDQCVKFGHLINTYEKQKESGGEGYGRK